MVNLVPAPKCNAVLVVLDNLLKGWTGFDISVVVGIKSHKDEVRTRGQCSLVRLRAEHVRELPARVRLEHLASLRGIDETRQRPNDFRSLSRCGSAFVSQR
jgi:hypothetical protein